jgi:cysteine synthase A
MRVESVLGTIGQTAHIRLARLFPEWEVWVKEERSNPGGSIKDRIALSMIEDAERRGVIGRESTIIEPTSGNTGIGLALVCAVKGYRLVLVMPESFSVERRTLMAAYGATFDLTPRDQGMAGAIARARELVESTPGGWMPMQFDNLANVEAHRRTTAAEILDDFPDGIDALITGVGTGGHITGCAEMFRQRWPALRVYAVEPADSPVLSGGAPGPHAIQGIGAGFVPGVMRTDLIDGIITVQAAEAIGWARRSAREEGLLVGISSGAALAAVARVAPTLPARSRVLTFCYDSGERYLSVEAMFG